MSVEGIFVDGLVFLMAAVFVRCSSCSLRVLSSVFAVSYTA
jgi:hypothetical protein